MKKTLKRVVIAVLAMMMLMGTALPAHAAYNESVTYYGIHPYRYKGTVLKTIKATSQTTGATVTVKKGTTVQVSKKNKKTVSFAYKGGYYTTNVRNVRLRGIIYKRNAYSDKTATQFVNKIGWSSTTKYLFWVSTYSQRVYMFTGSKGNWKLKKSFQCSTGKFGTETPVTKSRIKRKTYKGYYEGIVSSYYCSYIAGGAFHTWPYGGLGRPASHGCVRLPDNMAKFIYYKVPVGSTVWIF